MLTSECILGKTHPKPCSLFCTQQTEGFFQNRSHDDVSPQNSSLTSHHTWNRSWSPYLHQHSSKIATLGLCACPHLTWHISLLYGIQVHARMISWQVNPDSMVEKPLPPSLAILFPCSVLMASTAPGCCMCMNWRRGQCPTFALSPLSLTRSEAS